MKVLHVIESLDHSGCARQLQVLGPLFPRSGIELEVCCLKQAGRWATDLRQGGVSVHELGWSRWFDPAALWRLRGLVRRCRPDVVHVWRRTSLRWLALAVPECMARVVLSAPLPARTPLSAWDRWLLGRVHCLAATGPSDVAQCAGAGLDCPVEVVPRAVPSTSGPAPVLTLPARAQRLVCVGALERQRGFHLALWAMDILNYLYPEAHLLIAGTGPAQADLHALAGDFANQRRIHFLGAVDDVPALLRSADIVWLPSHANVGRQVAVEALAAGCAVIAMDVPCLRDLIDDGSTGLLVPRGDVIGLARRTRLLLDDSALRDRLGAAARAAAQQRWAATPVAQRWCDLYRRVAA
jgi:glycosyltransferase involved in cell wall biosynthesis